MKRLTSLWLMALVVATLFAYHSGYEAASNTPAQWLPAARADITDEPNEDNSLNEAATFVRDRMRNILLVTSRDCQAVHEKVTEHGKAELAGAINAQGAAGDAAQMQAIYNAQKAIVNGVFGETGTKPNPQYVIPDLP